MSAIKLIEQLEQSGIHLWLDNGNLCFEGDNDVLTDDVIEQLRINKTQLIETLNHPHDDTPAANDEPLPYEWEVALHLIDQMRAEKGIDGKGVNKKEWLHRLRYVLNLTEWQANELKAMLNSRDYIAYNHMNNDVERTTPAYENAARDFLDWARDNGVLYRYHTLPTGYRNHGGIRKLPSDTAEGLYAIMGNDADKYLNKDKLPDWLEMFETIQ